MTWSRGEVAVLARAVHRAPSVHNSEPWVVEIRPQGAELYERIEATLPRHDPLGRDRLISCGAALANLELAVRTLGWDAHCELYPSREHPEMVARVTAAGRSEASDTDIALYSAIFRRRSYRAPFRLHHLSGAETRVLVESANTDGAQARTINGDECAPLAELLGYAARAMRSDRAYQRELRAWTAQFRGPLPRESTLPWGGLVRPDTHLPDDITLTERLRAERLLLVLTPDDASIDHVRAGATMERIWLTAVSREMAGSVLTQPLQLPEVRAGLIERLELAGHPQLILRLGYPVTAPPYSSEVSVSTAERA